MKKTNTTMANEDNTVSLVFVNKTVTEIKAALDTVPICKTLKVFYIGGKSMVWQAIGEAATRVQCQELNVSKCQLKHTAFSSLLAGIGDNETLWHLNMADNPTASSDASELMGFFKTHSRMTHATVNKTSIPPFTLRDLHKTMTHNRLQLYLLLGKASHCKPNDENSPLQYLQMLCLLPKDIVGRILRFADLQIHPEVSDHNLGELFMKAQYIMKK